MSTGRLLFLFAAALAGLPARSSAQCPDGTPPPCTRRVVGAGTIVPANSVAVLYFENLGRDTTDVYIADGLTEEVTARLGSVSRLTVTSRAAVRRLHNAADMAMAAIGQALRAQYLVNGSVRHAGNRLRVTVELVRASSGTRVWGDQYDRPDGDLLGLQEDIARAVASGIAGQLLPNERAAIAARPTRNAAAYDHYLRGIRLMTILTVATAGDAMREFETALRLDPSFTAARARIGMVYANAINWSLGTAAVPAESLLARGMAAMNQALRADSSSSEAWAARGFLLMFARPKTFDGALEAFRRSLALDPENIFALNWYASAQRRLGQYDASLETYRRLIAIDPTFVQALSDIGFVYLSRKQYADAARWYDSAIVVDTSAWQSYLFRATARAEQADSTRALADARAAVRIGGAPPVAVAVLASVEARFGDTAAARRRLEPVLAHYAATDTISVREGIPIVGALVALGDRDRALTMLERTRPRGAWLWSYLMFSGFNPIRQEPRFRAIYDESKPPGVPDQ